MRQPPRFKHDCTACVFQGQDGELDMYWCPRNESDLGGTILARYSDEPSEYSSMPVELVLTCSLKPGQHKDHDARLRVVKNFLKKGPIVRDFAAAHDDEENSSNVMGVTAAYQKRQCSSDADMLDLALTWMCQINAAAGWITMLSECEKQMKDSDAAWKQDQEEAKLERQRAAVAMLGPAYGIKNANAAQQLLNKYVEECAEMSHRKLDSEINYQKSSFGTPEKLRIAQAELAKRKQTDNL